MNLHLTTYDDKIPYLERYDIWKYIVNSTYTLGWTDSFEPGKYDLNIHSNWTVKELQDSGIYSHIETAIENTEWFTNKKIIKIVVNLVRPDDVYYIHNHKDAQTVLYYANLDWQDGWYGETIFYDPQDIKSIAHTSLYVPGRMILFDGSIPHAIRPQSIKAPKYRFTLTVFYGVDKILK